MRRTAPASLLATALAAGLLAGCGGSGSGDANARLAVSSAYMPQPVSDSMAAGFLTIVNDGGAKDELTKVTSDMAGDVTVHETVRGVMRETQRLTVPAHGRLVLRSGGNHLMFEDLKRRPRQGQTVSVELHFATSGPVTVEMPVKSATYSPETGH